MFEGHASDGTAWNVSRMTAPPPQSSIRRLHFLAFAVGQAELSQQQGHPPRPSALAHHLTVSTTEVINGLHAAEAYKSRTG
ncbi:MAG: hypothetical protein M3325_04240 [Actinomycetota bacterium]|jgi:hypothetical protein|nr:hypothetical protein [Actinomycetota bacterium]MDQ3904638.1 hypothetical protein [Actinomycetota bacterium]